jgi:hypothetical protein
MPRNDSYRLLRERLIRQLGIDPEHWHPPMRADLYHFTPGIDDILAQLFPGNPLHRGSPIPQIPYATIEGGGVYDPIGFWGQAVGGIPARPGNSGLPTEVPRVPYGIHPWDPNRTQLGPRDWGNPYERRA